MSSLKYFAFFKYVPTLAEYWQFYPQSITLAELRQSLKKDKLKLVRGRVVSQKTKIYLSGTLKRRQISLAKLKKRQLVIQLLGLLPWIKFIGLSGTVSMFNAEVKDDIDLFVITARERLWTTRFCLLLLTSLFGIRRKPYAQSYKDQLCFNLFFSEVHLAVPKFKRTVYVAHEILQLKPLVDKNQTYAQFIKANQWVFKLFPNSLKLDITKRHRIWPLVFWKLISNLNFGFWYCLGDWFFPLDFEKQVAKFSESK